MIVQTAGLTCRFGSLVAVDGLDLQLPAGGVIGLVGPNGSGKSTLIRMLLGLIASSSGSAEVLGHPISEPQRYAGRVGALVENPAFVAGLSARSNLDANDFALWNDAAHDFLVYGTNVTGGPDAIGGSACPGTRRPSARHRRRPG